MPRRTWLCAALLPLSACFPREIELIGTGSVPGSASDGLTLVPAVLEDGTPHDRLGGFGSGIAYTGVGTKYVATPDRGPSGKTSYANRYYLFDIVIDKGGARVDVRLIAAKTLSNESGQPFVGTESVFDPAASASNRALDPEAIRISGRGTFFLSDEYGPFISEFDAEGKELRRLSVPAKFASASGPGKKGDDGQNPRTL
ncbi:MAG TPA: esterase-like activity of phytase family protein, partial [Polyangiaceae bacterium]|nr:esterase-like activity of phytase family protein [Polyangiaceae bacterium]